MQDDPNLDSAYGLSSPEDNKKLYRAWAETYDQGFADSQNYILHEAVARHFAQLGGLGPVLDVGAGTGLCGEVLRAEDVTHIHGTDISPEMLERAASKGIYEELFESDLLQGLPCADNSFSGAVSSGTFTLGHLGPEPLDDVCRVVQPGGLIVISINAQHYSEAGFEAYFARAGDNITGLTLTPTRIYAEGSVGEHADDKALLTAFRPA